MRKSDACTAEVHQIQDQRSQKRLVKGFDGHKKKSGDPPEKARKNAASTKKIDFICSSCYKKRHKERFYFASRSNVTMQRKQMSDCVLFYTARENSFACAGPATQLHKGMHVDFPKNKRSKRMRNDLMRCSFQNKGCRICIVTRNGQNKARFGEE